MQLMGNELEKLFATRIQHAFSGNLTKLDVISEKRERERERERENVCVVFALIMFFIICYLSTEWNGAV
jgi:hypothetical protein